MIWVWKDEKNFADKALLPFWAQFAVQWLQVPWLAMSYTINAGIKCICLCQVKAKFSTELV